MATKATAGDFGMTEQEPGPRRKAPAVKRKRRIARRPAPVATRSAPDVRPRAPVPPESPFERFGPPPAEEVEEDDAPGKPRPYSLRKGGKPLAKGEKPRLGLPDPLEAAREEALHMKEGNRKLGLAVEALRAGLEVITVAEWDHRYKRPVSVDDLRKLAVEALDAYSGITGQSWRRHRLTGPTLAGGVGNAPVHESQMSMPQEE